MKESIIKSNFREWTLDTVDEAFGLKQVHDLPALNELLAYKYNTEVYEKTYLINLKEQFVSFGGDYWNEVELENKIISPIIVFSGIQNKEFSYFLNRNLSTTIGEYDFSGFVDSMIATGFRNPKKPLFCLNKYKKNADPYGDPKGQALMTMFVAQHLNENKKPIFGSFIIGRHWYFMALVGKEYAISSDFSFAKDTIFDIYRVLKSLRIQIEKIL